MFGKKGKTQRERELYAQLLQNARGVSLGADRYPEIRRAALHEAREQARQERVAQEEWALQRETETRRELQRTARQGLPEIIKGLQHDGVQPSKAMIRRFTQMAIEAFVNGRDGWKYDPAQVQEVFEREYREALKKREEGT